MNPEYPKPLPTVKWDTFYTEYPVRKFPSTGVSSETIARKWRDQPLVLRDSKHPVEELKQYMRDYNSDKALMKSVTSLAHGYKEPETRRYIKHNSCMNNEYIYPVSRRIEYRPPDTHVHGTTEMKSAYTPPDINPRLVTDKAQFKHELNIFEPPLDPSFHKDLEPIHTTDEGYEKLLDPYLTTSRLYHRPFTADQLKKPSNANDIITFYTFANVPWVRRPKPECEYKVPLSRPKSMYDREKFKQDRREIITHNTLHWVPGSFRTETRDNYTTDAIKMDINIENIEEKAKTEFRKGLAHLSTNTAEEDIAMKQSYRTENSHVGSGKPVFAVLDQHVEKNKRLERKSMRIG